MDTHFYQADQGDEHIHNMVETHKSEEAKTEMDTISSPLYDDVTHPDGSDSNIPYWVRKKIAEIDELANEVISFFQEEYDHSVPETHELMDSLIGVQFNISVIQENEGWI
jgi:hypothetical protein